MNDIASKQLRVVVSAAKHCKNISFVHWDILVQQEVDFKQSLVGSKIRWITFGDFGDGIAAYKLSKYSLISNILKSLGKAEGFSKNLKRFRIICSDMTQEQIKKIMDDSGFQDKQLYTDYSE